MNKLLKLIFLISGTFAFFPSAARLHAASEGPASPSSASGTNWKNPSNVYSSDNSRSSYNNSLIDIFAATAFGFSSVSGAIDGIKVEIEGYGTGASPPVGDQIDIALTKNGSVPAGSWKSYNALPNGLINEAYITRGDSTDVWGTAWTPSDIANSNFGVLIRDSDIGASPLYIDHIRVTVYYSDTTGSGRRLKLQQLLSGD